jgi:Ca-activated chloride channel family protein
VVVVGRYTRPGSDTVTVRGQLAGRPFARRVSVTLPARSRGAKNEALAHLWARRRIAGWMDVYRYEHRRRPALEKAVTKVALAYNLMSKFTSFVAVDHQVRNQGGQQVTVPVPVPLPQGVSPKAAPSHAFAGGLRGRAASGMMKQRRLKRLAPRPSRAPVGTESLDDATAEEEPTPPTRRRTRSGRAKLHLGHLHVSGSARQAVIRAALQRHLRALARQARSLARGTRGTLKVRLAVNASGQVTRVAFVSGSLVLPSITKELKRLMQRWRFGRQPSASTVTFTFRTR